MKVVCFDLDDTLYKEIDFVKSAFGEVVSYACSRTNNSSYATQDLVSEMLEAYHSGVNSFELLNAILGLEIPLSCYLNIYRNHQPKLTLSSGVDALLNLLKANGFMLGLITDGRSVQQRNKIEALGLYKYFDESNIIISEEFGTEKPSEKNYRYFMELYPDAYNYVYVGDNIQKDFVAAKCLGWTTICLTDDGRNIHKQSYEMDEAFLPDKVVNSLSEIIL